MSEIRARNFEHRTGFHCGSSAVRSILRHFGHELSEPMCLGLGMGVNFFYFKMEDASPTRMFNGRSPTLEEDFFANLDACAPMRWHADAASAWLPVKAALDAGHPVMIQADIHHLPYYNTKVHFGGHKVIIAGYDPDEEIALVSDSEFPEIQRVSLAQLAKARFDPSLPWDLKYQWWDVREIPAIAPLEVAVPRALSGAAQRMMRDHTGIFGIAPLRRMEKDLPRFGEAGDWKWCARFGYQVIERRGTGGGSFRTKYADFLEESRPYDPRIDRLGLVAQMRRIGEIWTDFAMLLKSISEKTEPVGFGEAARIFGEIAEAEEEFFRSVDERK